MSNQDQNNEDKLLTVKEAAQLLDCSISQLYKLTSNCRIPHYKPFGKKIYFSQKSIIEHIKKSAVKTTTEINQEAIDFVMNHNGRKYKPKF